MSVLVAWPTVDVEEAAHTAKIWQAQGYDTAILVNEPCERPWEINHLIFTPTWNGFPTAANLLCQAYVNDYDIIVIGGNDLYPDQTKSAKIIEQEFKDHFNGTYGIMHPTGDRYGLIDDAAICPWIGAEYIKRTYQGVGPYYSGYYHYFCDGELQDVAAMKNAFWQRPDLKQYHNHWSRNQAPRPQHLMPAKGHHPVDQCTYIERKRLGFPGSEDLV